MQEAFQITIRDTTSGKMTVLDCTRILRQIKGRRTVYEGTRDGKPVIVKCFHSALHGRRHFKREIDGFKELTLRNIQTAQIIAAGQNEQGRYTLVLEKIANAIDVFSLLESTNDPIKMHPVLQTVFTCVAQMHAAGILQRDLHTGNFLWNGQTLYVLDPAEMQFHTNSLDKPSSFRQLAVLLGSLPKMGRSEQIELLDAYFASRGWSLDAAALDRIEQLTAKQRLRGMQRMLRKTLRTSKRTIRVKHGPYGGVFVRELVAGQNPEDFIANVDNQMEAGQVLKRGNTCFVSRIELNGQDVVVKRYNHQGLRHSLRHTIKGSRAKKCWLFGHRLLGLGIGTPKPLGFVEQRKLGLVWQSYILNQFIDGPNIRDYFKRSDVPDTFKEAISQKTRKMLDHLVRFKMTHGDLKPSNLLIDHDTPVLIDLDSMKRHPCPWLLRLYQRKMNDNINERNILWTK